MRLIVVSIVLIYFGSLSAQCPDRDFLWSRLVNLKFSKLPPKVQVDELLATLDSVNSCSWKNDSTHIYLIRKICDIYFKEGDYLRAAQYRHLAIDITRANSGKLNVKQNTLPGLYYWLSVVYDSLNNVTEKMKALDSCSAIGIRLNYLDRASLYALNFRVEYYFHIGDYQRCIDYAKKCEFLSHQYASANTGAERIAGEGFASTSLGWHVNALLKLSRFEEAEEILKIKEREYKKAGLLNLMGLVYGQLAQLQESKGDYNRAIFYFNKSLECYRSDKDQFNCKQTLKDIGYNIYFKRLGDGAKALAFYKNALKYVNDNRYSKTANNFESLSIYSHIGEVYSSQGFYDSAFSNFQLSFDQVRPGCTEDDIIKSTPQELMRFKRNYYLTNLLISKGDTYRRQYEKKNQKELIQKAIHIYKVTDQLLDRFKKEQTEIESKLFWRSDSRRLYEKAIDACYLNKNLDDAFYFFEKSRAVLLQDQLTEQKWLDGVSIQKLTQIKKRLVNLEKEFTVTGKNTIKYKDLENEQFRLKQELSQLQEKIRTANPLYFQNFIDSSNKTLNEVRKFLLKDFQALVETFVGDGSVYILIITANDVQFNKVGRSLFDSLEQSYSRFLANPSVQNQNFGEFVHVSSKLYQLIFQNKTFPPGRIIISPDGHYFPFEALVTNGGKPRARWLLEEYAVSYTYSARFLFYDFSPGTSVKGENFMGVSPVYFPPSFALASLSGSDQSINRIATYFEKPLILSAANASKTNFLKQFSKYRVLQLYTHAADSSINNEPVIYFADSALYLSELMNEHRPLTQLVVLSACETGSGDDYLGEGVFSFNRGFAAMGIPAAVTNLWSVENKSTYQLTELFYKYLSEGLPTDIALQKAKLEYIQTSTKEKSLPCFWAAPVLVGKAGMLRFNKTFPWLWILLLTGTTGVAIFVGKRYRRGKIKKPL